MSKPQRKRMQYHSPRQREMEGDEARRLLRESIGLCASGKVHEVPTRRGDEPHFYSTHAPRLIMIRSGATEYHSYREGRLVSLSLEAGDVVFVSPDGWVKATRDRPFEAFALCYETHYIRCSFSLTGARNEFSWYHHHVLRDELSRKLFAALEEGCEANAEPAVKRHLVAAVLEQTVAAFALPESVSPRARSEGRLQQVLEYLESHYTRPITRAGVARVLGMHESHLSRLFKAKGLPGFNETLNRLRVEHAELLLRERHDLSVAAVALECGYGDSAYFIKQFKRHTGATPLKYRETS